MTTIEIPKPIQNQGELLSLQSSVATTPEGGAAVLVAALLAWAQDDPRAEVYLASALDAGQLQCGQIKLIYRQRLARQLKGGEHIVHSYLEGATPANGYRLPDPPYRVSLSRNPYSGEDSSGRVKVFVACSGAATPRPVTLKRGEDGLWRGHEWSSLLLGVAPVR